MATLAATALAAVPIAILRFVPPPTTAFMLRSRHADPATGAPCPDVAYAWVPREAIAADLRLAVLVAEDQRFYQHRGFDFGSMRRAFRDRVRYGRRRGASTLTQQLAKNLFLWPDATYTRKLVEAWFTFWIETLWPKERILEVYLNVAQFGPCRFGVGASSGVFFDKRPAALEAREAALLAAVLPSPARMRAHDPGPYALERTDAILALMAEHRGRLGRR